MAVTEARVYGPAQPGTVTGVLYTVPAATSVTVKQIIMANTTGVAATVTIGVGGTAAANQIVPAVSIPANSVYTFDCSIPLATGETIDGLQGTAGAVTVVVSGYTVT